MKPFRNEAKEYLGSLKFILSKTVARMKVESY